MINPYKKGYRGEKELEELLHRFFPENKKMIRRVGTQESFKGTSGDVVCFDQKCILSRFHIENKNREKMNLFELFEKTVGDAKGNLIPIMFCKKNNSKRLLIIEDTKFLGLLKELQGYEQES